jgi:two-component system, response regulator PdtaR
MGTTKVLIAEDEPMTALGLQDALRRMGYPDSTVVMEAAEILDEARKFRPDIVLLDIRFGDEKCGTDIGLQLFDELFVPIVFITAFSDNDTLNKAKACHPVGYLPKPFIPEAVRSVIEIGLEVHRSRSALDFPSPVRFNSLACEALSQRELDVLFNLIKGKGNQEMAQELFISENTLKSHLKNIYQKFNVGTRAQLMGVLSGRSEP